jgi:hypothetical protein
MFRHLLVLPDGEPNDPAVFVTAVPNWSDDEVITLGDGEQLRIVAIADPSDELAAHGFRSIFRVEPIGG